MRRIMKKAFLVLLCLVLAGGLMYLLVNYKKAEIQEQERLEKLVTREKQKKTETTEKKQKEETEETPEETQEQETDSVPQETPVPSETHVEQETTTKAPEGGIACWGDEILSNQAAATDSYTVVLQKLLTEQGYQIPVENKTLTETCSLTVMKMAGVPMTDIDAYIAKHAAAANGAQLPITEGSTRDLNQEQMTRTDQNYIPVLFMGYYGGWNYDLAELEEQQQKVLDTFGENKGNFIIVGLPPAGGKVYAAQNHTAMSQKWGEHYINVNETCPHGLLTAEGQAELAQVILNKLKELNYIPDAA